MACSGNDADICGGPNGLSVFRFDASSSSTSAAATQTSASSTSTQPTQPAQSTTAAQPTQSSTSTKSATSSTAAQPSQSSTITTGSTTSKAISTTTPVSSTKATSTTATAPAATPSGGTNSTTFKYQGCYTDNDANGRSLTAQQPDSQKMTVESCIAQCSSLGYHIAGLQYSSQCFCDNYIHNSPSLVPDSQCNMACAGNSSEMCGAGNRNSIYTNGMFTLLQAQRYH